LKHSGLGLYGTKDFCYFYVSGANKVYRIDRDRHWVVWAKSYEEEEDSFIERKMVRHKYLFKMSDYNSVDEAVRDLIDKVSYYRKVNLSAYIDGGLPIHTDLSGSITPFIKYSWIKYLYGNIKGYLRYYIGTESKDLNSSIVGV